MIRLIAETAWHHEGDYLFMKNLVTRICESSKADIVKMHLTLDLDEYMNKDHEAYATLKSWMFSPEQWEELISIVRTNGKELMLLLNDVKSIEFAKKFSPEIIEIHSVALNVPRLQEAIIKHISEKAKIVIGVGGCSHREIEEAVTVFHLRDTVLMFGFQNYPTKYEDVNLLKIRKMQKLFHGKSFGYADHTAWDEENNQLITLVVSSKGMDFIEKHVTTNYGEERCDFSAAISIDQLNQLHDKLVHLDNLYGNGSMDLNNAEKKYSLFGPMKMAAIANHNLLKGKNLQIADLNFCRTSQITDMSQLDILQVIGKRLASDIRANQVILSKHIERQ